MVRRRGTSLMAVGSAVSGVAAYVFFALVTRALGAERAAPVSLLWTYWGFAAAALTFPVQHWIIRSVAASGGEGGVRRAWAGVSALCVLLALVAGGISWLGRDTLFHRHGTFFALMVVLVTLGSAFMGGVRGVLAARERFAAVGLALVAENGVRCVVAGILVVEGSADARAYGLVLAAGGFVAAAWPGTLRLGRSGEPQPWLRFVAAASGGQLIGQTVLAGGPVVLAFLGGTPGEVTGLFTALALFRAPYTLAIGGMSPVTAFFTRLVVQGRRDAVRRALLGVAALTLAGVGLAAVIGGLAGPWLLRLVFGASIDVPTHVTLLVAIGSAVALGSLGLAVMAMAHDRSHAMLRAWAVAIVVAAVVIVAGPGSPLSTVAAAFCAAQAVAFLVLLGGELRVAARAVAPAAGASATMGP